jgi:hypothetical protein
MAIGSRRIAETVLLPVRPRPSATAASVLSTLDSAKKFHASFDLGFSARQSR